MFNNIYIIPLKFIGHLLRYVEVLLCIRKKPYKEFRL